MLRSPFRTIPCVVASGMLVLMTCLTAATGVAETAGRSQLVESIPPTRKVSAAVRMAKIRRAIEEFTGKQKPFTYLDAVLWQPGDTLRVAFLGGSRRLRDAIANCAQEWADTANIHFAFGPDVKAGRYYEWTSQDKGYRYQIRIGFAEKGCWSYLGTQSICDDISPANTASMNLEGFDTKPPDDLRTFVLHEFGHALGLEHEHQNPRESCNEEIVWSFEPGYELTFGPGGSYASDPSGRSPGAILYFSGPPNNWTRAQTVANLISLRPDGLTAGIPDRKSIMYYALPEFLFVKRVSSACFAQDNSVLSEKDIAGIRKAYPAGQDPTVASARRQAGIRLCGK